MPTVGAPPFEQARQNGYMVLYNLIKLLFGKFEKNLNGLHYWKEPAHNGDNFLCKRFGGVIVIQEHPYLSCLVENINISIV